MDKQNDNEYSVERKYYGENDIRACMQFFLQKYPIKKDDGSLLNQYDQILGNYYLDFNKKIGHETLTIKYLYNDINIQNSIDYPDKEIEGNLDCRGRGTCEFVSDKGLFYPICRCREPYFGNDCKHTYYCNNCQPNKCNGHNTCSMCKKGYTGQSCELLYCSSLNMCGSYGNCTSNTDIRKCQCKNDVFGLYCTNIGLYLINEKKKKSETIFYLDDTTKLNTTFYLEGNTTKLNTKFYLEEKTTKLNIAVPIIISLIIAIFLVFGIAFYVIKIKNQRI